MLAKKFRLPSSVVFQNASFFQSPYFSIRMQSNAFSYPRFGFIVSKKIDKRAVARNEVKRKVRSCVEEHFLTRQKGEDILFAIKAGAKDASRDILTKEMKKILEK